MYSNYASFIKRAEIRIFEQQQSLEAAPLRSSQLRAGLAEMASDTRNSRWPSRDLKYLIRATDSNAI